MPGQANQARLGWIRRLSAVATRPALALLLLGIAAPDARAGSVAFEDDGMVPAGHWQLNTIVGVYPLDQKVTGSVVANLDPAQAAVLTQISEEFRYGISDRLMIRTTLPLDAQIVGTGALAEGLGDSELFLKGALLDPAGPLGLTVGLQGIFPTAVPALFSLNGSPNLQATVVLRTNLPVGEIVGTAGYFHAFDQRLDGQAFHPPDSVPYALGWNVDVDPSLNLAIEGVGSEGFSASEDGVPVSGTAYRQVTVGPGCTWSFSPTLDLQASLQFAVLRQGTSPASSPVSGLFLLQRVL